MAGQNDDVFAQAYRKVVQTVERAFFAEVEALIPDLREELKIEAEQLFYDIRDGLGGEAAPSEIEISWAALTQRWKNAKNQTRKYTPGKEAYGLQRATRPRLADSRISAFYRGKTSELLGDFEALEETLPYGVPEVRLRGGSEISLSSGRARIPKGFKGAGQFASLSAVLEVVMFPKLTRGAGGLLKPFKGKTFFKMQAAEYGNKKDKRPARPFLLPFIEYYERNRAREAVNKALGL